MTSTRYAGRSVTFGTRHGKEWLAQRSFREVLGAIVAAAPGIDTDQFGTFAGDVPRTLSPLAAARAKARLAMQSGGTTLALASEGSFTPGLTHHVENVEILMFIDGDLGMELVEEVVDTSPLPAGRQITSASGALDFAEAIGFPVQGLIVSGTADGHGTFFKNLVELDDLESAVTSLLADRHTVMIQPDYRSHRAPSRAAVIGMLCTRMAARLATECPQCLSPGFGQTGVELGLPCAACGSATGMVFEDVRGCARCQHRVHVPRVPAVAEPRWCDRCNP